MIRSSLTEETPATPGWVDGRIDTVFAPLGAAAVPAREAYATCLAGVRGSVDTDAGHDRCRARALAALRDLDIDVAALDRALQALEAELSAST
jgi:hypothetical protein